MRICGVKPCRQWAQWRVTYPDKTVLFVCQAHKDSIQKGLPAEDQPKFIFVGAMPDAIEQRIG